LDFNSLLKELKSGQFKPLYFLHGDESFFIDTISNYIEKNALPEAEQSFNQTILYGKETDHLTVVDVARRYPMMSAFQVVILKEAQEMKTLAKLQTYVEQPMPTTVLVICYKHKKLNLNSAFGKALKKQAVILEAKPLYDNQVPEWIVSYLKGKKLKIGPAAAELVAEYLGTNLGKVANELDKLAINLPEGSEVSGKHIEENIGISREYNVFELQRALALRDTVKANRIIRYFISNPKKNPLVVVIGTLYNYFSKIYMLHFLKNTPDKELQSKLGLRSGYFLREYRQAARHFNRRQTEAVISILKEYDLKSKGVDFNSTNAPDGALLTEMVWRILKA
jgi:DNA polymerase-3 subunit delta